jgi:hypothetical protein
VNSLLRAVAGRPAAPARERGMDDEAAAIMDLYFRERSDPVDPGLVERLLWWEGVELPAAPLYRAHAPFTPAAA